jgi:hypothetical protein
VTCNWPSLSKNASETSFFETPPIISWPTVVAVSFLRRSVLATQFGVSAFACFLPLPMTYRAPIKAAR